MDLHDGELYAVEETRSSLRDAVHIRRHAQKSITATLQPEAVLAVLIHKDLVQLCHNDLHDDVNVLKYNVGLPHQNGLHVST